MAGEKEKETKRVSHLPWPLRTSDSSGNLVYSLSKSDAGLDVILLAEACNSESCRTDSCVWLLLFLLLIITEEDTGSITASASKTCSSSTDARQSRVAIQLRRLEARRWGSTVCCPQELRFIDSSIGSFIH